MAYEIENIESKTSEEQNWIDITKEFRTASKELELGELLHDDSFGLFEAMSAIEMMDPKMDAGMFIRDLAPVRSYDELVKVTFSNVAFILIDFDLSVWSLKIEWSNAIRVYWNNWFNPSLSCLLAWGPLSGPDGFYQSLPSSTTTSAG